MDSGEQNRRKRQNIIISDRTNAVLSGVEDIISFDDTNIVMKTILGTLSVDGTDLHIVKLDLEGGDVALAGTVNGMYYIQDAPAQKQNGGRLGRLFR